MTTDRFAAYVEETEPKIEKWFMPGDGYRFAADFHSTLEGGEWPYLIAVHRSEVSLSEVVTYCEGDVTRYTFADKAESTEAARLWEVTDEEYAAQFAAESPWAITSPSIGTALVSWLKERDGHHVAEFTDDNLTRALEHYRGEFENDADYAEEYAASHYSGEYRDPEAPEWVMVSPDWEDTALNMRHTPGLVFDEYSGHYFTTGD